MGNQLLQCGRDTDCIPQPSCTRRWAAGGPSAAIDLPPEMLCQRTFGFGTSESSRRCEPSGAVFPSTVHELSEMDRAVLQFSGSSNLAAVRWLLLLGANSGCRDCNGTSLLHAASRSGSLLMVRELVKRGLSLDATDDWGWTPLHVASCMGRRDVALCLLQAGADPQPRNSRGLTPEELCSHPFTKDVILGYVALSRGSMTTSYPADSAPNEGLRGSGMPGSVVGAEAGGSITSLRFEPCFVPREPLLQESTRAAGQDTSDDLGHLAVDIFNRSAGHGLAFLVATGTVRDYPVEIKHFLLGRAVDPRKFGDFLGEDCPLAQNLRLEMLNSMQFVGTGVVSALAMAFRDVAVPTDLLGVDRMAQSIAHFWWTQHDEELKARSEDDVASVSELPERPANGEVGGFDLQRGLLSEGTMQLLVFSSLMLHRWLKAGRGMTLNEWIQVNAGIEGGGGDLAVQVQSGIYHALSGDTGVLAEGGAPELPGPAGAAFESVGYVHYNGRARASHNGIPADFPAQRLRLLAARGGVSSSGRGAEEAVARGASRDEMGGEIEEAATLSLHQRYLLLAPSQATDGPPYAFVPLRHVVLRVIDAERRRLVLASRAVGAAEGVRRSGRTNPPRSAVGAKERLPSLGDDWLTLCLLLADGRFQPMEAPRLQLRFEDAAAFESWAALLSEACSDRAPVRAPTPGPKGGPARRVSV